NFDIVDVEHGEHAWLYLSHLVLHVAHLEDVGRRRGLVAIRHRVGRGRRFRLGLLDFVQLQTQRGSRLPLGGRQRVHYFAPQRLDLLFGVFGERLLLRCASVFGNIERLTQVRLERRQLLLPQRTARPFFDLGDLLLRWLESRLVVFLRPVVRRFLVGGRDLGVF